MPKLKRFRMRRTQLLNKSKAEVSNSVACMCADVSGIVAANEVRLRSAEVNMKFVGAASSVASIVKHKIQNVCTWKNGQYTVFNKMCKVTVEQTSDVKKSELYERLQEMFFIYESCLLAINGEFCAIMKHNDYYVVVDCNVRNASGLGSDIGTSVVVFNTNWQDLFLHINALMVSLSADTLNICGAEVQVIKSEMSACVKSNVTVESGGYFAGKIEESQMFTSNERENVRGSCHQGDSKFRWPGKQCVAVSLVAMAMHKVHSVFSWETNNLDDVVSLGDSLYADLRQSGSITDPTKEKLLCIPDLPQEYVFETNAFKVGYDDFVSGYVDIVDGELIRSGACVTLAEGLQTMFDKYDTCFLTLNGNTCAIIKENRQFAVVDSHARSSSGMVDGNGFSVVVYHKTLTCVLKHIQNLAACFGRNVVFEISGVCVEQIKSSNTICSQAETSRARSETKNCVGKKRSLPLSLKEMTECREVKKQKYNCKESSKIIEKKSKCNVNADVICLGDRGNTMFNFSPLCFQTKQKLCSKLHVEFQGENPPLATNTGPMGRPCKTESIVGDGNCFFRAVAQVVCGTQKAHRALRLAIVKDMQLHSSEYKNLLRSQYTSMEDYLCSSKMRYVGTWATEVEIQSTANYLGVDIFTFHHEKWLKQFESHNCYELCHSKKDDVGKCTRTRQSVKAQSEVYGTQATLDSVGEDINIDVSVNNSSYFQKYYLLKRVKSKIRQNTQSKYHNNTEFQQHMKAVNRTRLKLKEYNKVKYCDDEQHRFKLKEYNKVKYCDDEQHRLKLKEYSRVKYRDDEQRRLKLKEYSRIKYCINEKYRNTLKDISKIKYLNNPLRKENVKKQNKLRKEQLKQKQKLFNCIRNNFEQKVNSDLDFVCCVCHRLLFREQVLRCQRDHYNQNSSTMTLAKKCITDVYLHKCNNECALPCELMKSCKGQLWICFTCHSKLKKGEMPAESAVNSLELQPVPEELCCLNSLEQHLIALHIPFMKMLALPKGRQNGVHGPVTCVPANVKHTTNALPRTSPEGSLVCIKLKRKLTYKGHYKYQYVDTNNIKKALCYLKKYNKYYSDVVFNEDWLNEFHRQDNIDDDKSNTEETDVENVNVDEELHDRQQHCVFMDTCLQPVDIGQEVLDQYFDSILSVAPAEGNNPVKLLADETNEAKCFPVLFPNGSPAYHDKRAQRLTLSRYFNNRILHADGRFAKNIEYIFFAQYLSEPIRGTPAFWQGVQKDLFAMVRQLGIPTWFCSFSSADMRWTNLMSSILKQEARKETLEQLEWADKCAILRNNPNKVTAARIFDFRWHCFLKEVLMSPLQPIGEIVDYFYRVEFQQRGSPHVHCLFWIKNAPQTDKHSDEEVVEFIDKYISCDVPTDNVELHSIVTSVQLHSKHHSKTCKKKNTVCRFNFPKPPSLRTFICRRKIEDVPEKDVSNKDVSSNNCQNDNKEIVNECSSPSINDKINVKYAHDLMTAIKKAVLEQNINSVEELFDSVGINQDLFEMAYKCINNNTHIVLKRQLNDVWVNQYNKFALQCWNANMDIQYVTDAYACIVYIISYISKSEREMGLLLGNTQREATTQGNTDARQALRKLGSVYLHNREVSAQESVYRLTNMHLKECSRHVQFIPTGEDTVRMSLPLSVIQNKLESEHLKSEDIWMTSFVDRYKSRPNQSVFEDMCLATLASEYRIAYNGTSSANKIKLNCNFGFILKRTRAQPAIVCFARFSVTKSPEKFYQSLLQLFLPYRVDSQLKPVGFNHFQQFYREGKVCFSDGLVHLVHTIVNTNRALFEKDADLLDTAQRDVDNDGILENAWCLLCPEQQLEHSE
ncbi:OVARIAN TUMOR DOMAIN-containing deubiquitinating enzyme 10 [Labeo rohita]|uniref:OVARIAN TUMOR DOMAIN-containing deubiquitinating enzyme 10 n=1 Tax=Labeo rohita TaxID=84645 RepID=A0ABQ8L5T1_LABRO|nr:OVARIAN TUMOR DOMAIN-containing deubiquitinating enzyme 10 [Labeo rohita]